MSLQAHGAFDLVIVGGGFAGLAAARAASLRGMSVLVIDAKPALGTRLHTTGIFVREAADAYDIPLSLSRRVRQVRLYGPRRRGLDLDAPGYYFLTTDTAAVLRWLGEEAERAGAVIRTACRFEAAERDGGLWHVRAGGEPLACRYLLGADGARSAVAAALGLSPNRRFLIGVEREYEHPAGLDPDHLHVFLDSRTAPGYIAWAAVNPKGAQVGLAVSHDRKPRIDAFASEAEAMFGLDPAGASERRAGLIPCGGVVARWSRPGAMLVGDAAGMVSPLTGGGIHPALALGRRAGQAIADHLAAAGPPPEQAVRADLPGWALKLVLRGLMDLAPPNWMFDLALSTAPMTALARRVFFHRQGRLSPPPAPGP
jgi:flavin-dependent dehydrogenase